MTEKKKRASAADMTARVNAVYTMLLNGADRQAILKKAAADWQISRSSTDALIKRANALFEQQAEIIRERELGKALARHEDWIQQSLKVKDISEARQNQREISQLLALYQPQTVQIIAQLMTPADAKLLADLLALVKTHGFTAGDVFAAMMSEIASAQVTADDANT